MIITTTGGTVVENYWNNTNTGLSFAVVIPAGPYVDGNVQVQADRGDGFVNLGSPYTVLEGDTGETVILTATAVQFEAISGFAEGDVFSFRAVVTSGGEGSTTENVAGVNTIRVNQTSGDVLLIEYLNSGRDRGVITLRLYGSFPSSLVDMELTLIDPLNSEKTCSLDLVEYFDEAEDISFNKTLNLTPEDFGYENTDYFNDGAHYFTLTINYSTGLEVVDNQYFLFVNNAVQGFVDLFESNLTNTGVFSNNKDKLISECREYIQASVEFFRLTQFTTARRLLLIAQDLADIR
jgi:hypothetical protein